MSSPWTDLDRPPLSAGRLRRAAVGDYWRVLSVVERTGSTNADTTAAMKAGADRVVVIAEDQTAGRGRLGRQWAAPPRSAALISVGLVPAAAERTWPLLTLLAGCAAVEALAAVARIQTRLKWPNDVMTDGRKLGGILTERLDLGDGRAAVVIGIGLNVTVRPAELPVPTATSVAIAGGVCDREPLVAELLRSLARRLQFFDDTDGDPIKLLPDYRRLCATIGRDIELDLPGGRRLTGRAVDVDDDGRLVVAETSGATSRWAAGDVTHLRLEGNG